MTLSFALLCVFLVSHLIANPSGHDLVSELQRLKLLRAQYAPYFQDYQLPVPEGDTADSYYPSFFPQYQKLPEIRQKESDADQYYLPYLQPEFKDSNPSYTSSRLQETSLKEEEADKYYLSYTNAGHKDEDAYNISPIPQPENQKEEDVDKYYAHQLGEDPQDKSSRLHATNQRQEDADKYYLPYPTAVQKMTINMEDVDERENMILDIPKHLLKTKPFRF